MKTKQDKNNIGMIGAIIGATIAVSLVNKDNRDKIVHSLGENIKIYAQQLWEEFKKKGDTYIESNIKK